MDQGIQIAKTNNCCGYAVQKQNMSLIERTKVFCETLHVYILSSSHLVWRSRPQIFGVFLKVLALRKTNTHTYQMQLRKWKKKIFFLFGHRNRKHGNLINSEKKGNLLKQRFLIGPLFLTQTYKNILSKTIAKYKQQKWEHIIHIWSMFMHLQKKSK